MKRASTAMLAVYVNAGNDTNGNPRRGWAVHDVITATIVEFIDEGYNGRAELRKKYGEIAETGRFDITPRQYRELLKDFSR